MHMYRNNVNTIAAYNLFSPTIRFWVFTHRTVESSGKKGQKSGQKLFKSKTYIFSGRWYSL